MVRSCKGLSTTCGCSTRMCGIQSHAQAIQPTGTLTETSTFSIQSALCCPSLAQAFRFKPIDTIVCCIAACTGAKLHTKAFSSILCLQELMSRVEQPTTTTDAAVRPSSGACQDEQAAAVGEDHMATSCSGAGTCADELQAVAASAAEQLMKEVTDSSRLSCLGMLHNPGA